MTRTGNFEVTSSQRLNSSKGVVNIARFVATSFGVLTSTLIWFASVSVSGGNFLSARWMKDVDR